MGNKKRNKGKKRRSRKHHQAITAHPNRSPSAPRKPRHNKTSVKQEATMLLQQVMWDIHNYDTMTPEQLGDVFYNFELAWSVLQKHVKHTVVKT